MGKHIANLEISYELFRDMFHLPYDTQIIATRIDDLHWGTLIVTIENPELPEVLDGGRIPFARPRYRMYHGENSEALKIEREDWGVE